MALGILATGMGAVTTWVPGQGLSDPRWTSWPLREARAFKGSLCVTLASSLRSGPIRAVPEPRTDALLMAGDLECQSQNSLRAPLARRPGVHGEGRWAEEGQPFCRPRPPDSRAVLPLLSNSLPRAAWALRERWGVGGREGKVEGGWESVGRAWRADACVVGCPKAQPQVLLRCPWGSKRASWRRGSHSQLCACFPNIYTTSEEACLPCHPAAGRGGVPPDRTQWATVSHPPKPQCLCVVLRAQDRWGGGNGDSRRLPALHRACWTLSCPWADASVCVSVCMSVRPPRAAQ